MRRSLLAGAVVAGVLFALPARADNSADAQRLFEDGRALMEQSHYREACEKFLASETLAPSGGALLNLADCYEKDGKLASAWVRFREVAARAQASGRDDIEKHATKRALALEPRLSTLTFVVPKEDAVDGFVLTRDGEPIPRSAWSTSLPLDGGAHKIEAHALSRRAWSTVVNVRVEKDAETVTLPILEEMKSEAVPQGHDAGATPPAPQPASPPTSTRRYLSYGALAGGVIGVGVGSVFGLIAINKNNDARQHCPQSPQCVDAQGPALTQDAFGAATASTIGFIAGGALLAAGGILFFTEPAAPSVRVGLSSILIEGTF